MTDTREAISNVSDVLAFLADHFAHMDVDDFSDEARAGLYVILSDLEATLRSLT